MTSVVGSAENIGGEAEGGRWVQLGGVAFHGQSKTYREKKEEGEEEEEWGGKSYECQVGMPGRGIA